MGVLRRSASDAQRRSAGIGDQDRPPPSFRKYVAVPQEALASNRAPRLIHNQVCHLHEFGYVIIRKLV